MEQWLLDPAQDTVSNEEITRHSPFHIALEGHMVPFVDLAMIRQLKDSSCFSMIEPNLTTSFTQPVFQRNNNPACKYVVRIDKDIQRSNDASNSPIDFWLVR